jgi:hypothetical protein
MKTPLPFALNGVPAQSKREGQGREVYGMSLYF